MSQMSDEYMDVEEDEAKKKFTGIKFCPEWYCYFILLLKC